MIAYDCQWLQMIVNDCFDYYQRFPPCIDHCTASVGKDMPFSCGSSLCPTKLASETGDDNDMDPRAIISLFVKDVNAVLLLRSVICFYRSAKWKVS